MKQKDSQPFEKP